MNHPQWPAHILAGLIDEDAGSSVERSVLMLRHIQPPPRAERHNDRKRLLGAALLIAAVACDGGDTSGGVEPPIANRGGRERMCRNRRPRGPGKTPTSSLLGRPAVRKPWAAVAESKRLRRRRPSRSPSRLIGSRRRTPNSELGLGTSDQGTRVVLAGAYCSKSKGTLGLSGPTQLLVSGAGAPLKPHRHSSSTLRLLQAW